MGLVTLLERKIGGWVLVDAGEGAGVECGEVHGSGAFPHGSGNIRSGDPNVEIQNRRETSPALSNPGGEVCQCARSIGSRCAAHMMPDVVVDMDFTAARCHKVE